MKEMRAMGIRRGLEQMLLAVPKLTGRGVNLLLLKTLAQAVEKGCLAKIVVTREVVQGKAVRYIVHSCVLQGDSLALARRSRPGDDNFSVRLALDCGQAPDLLRVFDPYQKLFVGLIHVIVMGMRRVRKCGCFDR